MPGNFFSLPTFSIETTLILVEGELLNKALVGKFMKMISAFWVHAENRESTRKYQKRMI